VAEKVDAKRCNPPDDRKSCIISDRVAVNSVDRVTCFEVFCIIDLIALRPLTYDRWYRGGHLLDDDGSTRGYAGAKELLWIDATHVALYDKGE